MLRKFLFIFCIFVTQTAIAQELFVQTEPASNMPAKSVGLRLNNRFMPEPNSRHIIYRINPEVMWGISKKWMLHLNLFASDMMQPRFKFEGLVIYAKFRFLSVDEVHNHFRLAAYGKASLNDNPVRFNEIDLYGNNSGFAGGLVATQLLHKLALSADLSYTKATNNPGAEINTTQSEAIGYIFSAGYLILPRNYTGYDQTNVNLYIELMGKNNPANSQNYLDIAPSIQFIINSVTRIDISYRRQLSGNMSRAAMEQFFLRLEYNLFNLYK